MNAKMHGCNICHQNEAQRLHHTSQRFRDNCLSLLLICGIGFEKYVVNHTLIDYWLSPNAVGIHHFISLTLLSR